MKNILLVDDDDIFNLLNTKAIQRTGIPALIHTATDGKEAINLINDYYQGTLSLPEIILLDLTMPVMDGFTFIDAFRHLAIPGIQGVKIVIVTSSSNPEDLNRAKQLGIDNFLTKPISEADLRHLLT